MDYRSRMYMCIHACMLLFVHVHVLYSLPSHNSSLPSPPLPSPPLPRGPGIPATESAGGYWKWQRRVEGIGPPPAHGAAELWCPGRDGRGHDPLSGRQHWKVSEYMYGCGFVSVWRLDSWPNLPGLVSYFLWGETPLAGNTLHTVWFVHV